MKFRDILTRFKEPSTMAGLSMLAILFGANPEKVNAVTSIIGILFAPETLSVVTSTIGAVLAAGAVFMPEEKAPLMIVKGQG